MTAVWMPSSPAEPSAGYSFTSHTSAEAGGKRAG